jgi:hypothetical protein
VAQTIDPTGNPFASLTLIVAPAILTNACTVLIMSTSNRLGRTLDRARKLTDELEQGEAKGQTLEDIYLRELHSAEERTVILLKAMRTFYGALGGFASAAFLSLIGAVVAGRGGVLLNVIEGIAVTVGSLAVAALVYASILLVHETRIAVLIFHEQALHVQKMVKGRLNRPRMAPSPDEAGADFDE